METRAGQPPEGRLIEEARDRLNISQNKAAKMAGMSGTRWRQIAYGEASGGVGIKNPVHGNADTIAKMARAVELTPDDLRAVGRNDAARELTALLRDESEPAFPFDPDPSLRRLIDLWPQAQEWQRRAIVGVLEEMLHSESTESASKPDRAAERRTG